MDAARNLTANPSKRNFPRRIAFRYHCPFPKMIHNGQDYWATIKQLSHGQRISVLDEIAYMLEKQDTLRLEGRDARSVLDDEIFDDFFRSSQRLWEWTHIALRAPGRARNFLAYTERDGQGRTYYLADYLLHDEVIMEGVRVPESMGKKILEWDRNLCLPAVTGTNDPSHAVHFYFDPTAEREVAIMLRGGQYSDELGPCLDLIALYGRDIAPSYCSHRIFEV